MGVQWVYQQGADAISARDTVISQGRGKIMMEFTTAAVLLVCLGAMLLFTGLLPALAKPDPASEAA